MSKKITKNRVQVSLDEITLKGLTRIKKVKGADTLSLAIQSAVKELILINDKNMFDKLKEDLLSD